MTPEQIEATRSSFEVAAATIGLNLRRGHITYYLYINTEQAWEIWQAAKSDTLSQAVAPEPVRLTDDEILAIGGLGQGFANSWSMSFARAIEAALHAKGHAPAPLTA